MLFRRNLIVGLALAAGVISGCQYEKEQPKRTPAPAVKEQTKAPEFGPKSLARTMRPIEQLKDQPMVALVSNGAPNATVVIPDERGSEIMMNFGAPFKEDVREMAAKELVSHIRKATGAALPVLKSKDYLARMASADPAAAKAPAIYLGESEASMKAGFKADQTLPLDGFTVDCRNGSIAIIGLDKVKNFATGPNGAKVQEDVFDSNGTLYGVYDVLERWVGVRWYWPDEELGTIVPQTKNLVITPVRYADWPLYTLRTLWPESAHPDYWSDEGPEPRLHYKRWRYGLGDGFTVNHSYNFWKDNYTKTHPEYFLMRADGTREFEYYNGQLCFSEPGVLRQEVENLKNYYEKGDRSPWGKWAVWPHQSYIPVMPNDCNSRCFCGRCEKANAMRKCQDREGTESELVHGYFVKLAKEVDKNWPDKWLHICLYSNYLLPPETIAEYPPNVRATLCMQVGMEMLKEPAKFAYWKGLVDSYVKMCGGKPIYIWSYSNTPRSSTRAPIIAPNTIVKWRQANRGEIAGEFTDHEAGNIRSFALDHLSLYFWFRTKWSPDVDVQATLDEYYKLCYGPAAGPMKKFYDLLIDRWENVSWGLPGPAGNGASGALPMDKLYQETYSPEIRDQLKALSAEAKKLAPPGSIYAKRLDYVLPAFEPFYKEGEAMDRLNRGSTVAYVAPGTPKLDGKLDDPCWKNAGTRLGEAANGDPAPVDSRVWFAYDDNAFHLGARLAEPEMDKITVKSKKHDDAVYQDDCIEFFICPRSDPESYAQIVVNPEGIVFDGLKESIGFYSAAKNLAIRKAIVKRADGWDLEMSIPYAEMGTTKFAPGELRRANLIQNRGAPQLAARARGCYSFAPNFGQSFHNTRFFGSLIFTDQDRFREDFGPDVGKRWRAEVVHKEGFSNPEAYAKLIPGADFATLQARMSRSLHVAKLISEPSVKIPVRKGDQIELVYRGPLKGPIRAEISYNLTLPDGKSVFGWMPDNNVVVGLPMRRAVVDLWAVAEEYNKAPVGADSAELFNINIVLSSEPDTENALELHLLRVSPYTSATAK